MPKAKTPARPRVRPRRVFTALLAAVAVALTACTSAGMGVEDPVTPSSTAPPPSSAPPPAPATAPASAPPPAAATCKPSGPSLQISAQNIKFSTSCLAAPAGQAFTITFKNQDAGVPHDVAIYTSSAATTSLFKGAIVPGPATTTYHVPALKAGTYYFRCDIHPTQMFGTFVVG